MKQYQTVLFYNYKDLICLLIKQIISTYTQIINLYTHITSARSQNMAVVLISIQQSNCRRKIINITNSTPHNKLKVPKVQKYKFI